MIKFIMPVTGEAIPDFFSPRAFSALKEIVKKSVIPESEYKEKHYRFLDALVSKPDLFIVWEKQDDYPEVEGPDSYYYDRLYVVNGSEDYVCVPVPVVLDMLKVSYEALKKILRGSHLLFEIDHSDFGEEGGYKDVPIMWCKKLKKYLALYQKADKIRAGHAPGLSAISRPASDIHRIEFGAQAEPEYVKVVKPIPEGVDKEYFFGPYEPEIPIGTVLCWGVNFSATQRKKYHKHLREMLSFCSEERVMKNPLAAARWINKHLKFTMGKYGHSIHVHRVFGDSGTGTTTGTEVPITPQLFKDQGVTQISHFIPGCFSESEVPILERIKEDPFWVMVNKYGKEKLVEFLNSDPAFLPQKTFFNIQSIYSVMIDTPGYVFSEKEKTMLLNEIQKYKNFGKDLFDFLSEYPSRFKEVFYEKKVWRSVREIEKAIK